MAAKDLLTNNCNRRFISHVVVRSKTGGIRRTESEINLPVLPLDIEKMHTYNNNKDVKRIT